VIVQGVDREHARRRMLRALEEYVIEGVPTLIGFHRALLSHPCFVEGGTCHGIVESELLAQQAAAFEASRDGTVATGGRLRERVSVVELDGRRFEVKLLRPEPGYAALARRRRERRQGAALQGGSDGVVSPMQGTVLAVAVAEGDEVAAGQVICIVEAMKMENEIAAPRSGVVRDLAVAPGNPIQSGQVVCVVVPAGNDAGG
jgi:acetyl-CoA/propionyl-CoA carboxylase biotin carboxyl carrier protein